MNRPQPNLFVKPLIGLVALTLTSITVAAHAAPPAHTEPQALVRYADLDLGTEGGVAKLYQRIARAASRVCPGSESRELQRAKLARACQTEAIERAVAAVGNTRLAAVQASRSRRNRVG